MICLEFRVGLAKVCCAVHSFASDCCCDTTDTTINVIRGKTIYHTEMALQKLLLQGIRSFNPDQHEVIEFFHPMTVIVGPNGSGKTVSGGRLEGESEERERESEEKSGEVVMSLSLSSLSHPSLSRSLSPLPQTLIEALRYMTTGETPPGTTKGGGFVNDPKVCL